MLSTHALDCRFGCAVHLVKHWFASGKLLSSGPAIMPLASICASCCISPRAARVPAGTPVKEALELAVKQALQARKGALLPALLLPGAGGSSSSGWAAAGGSRLAAALSAAEINMNLRTRVRKQWQTTNCYWLAECRLLCLPRTCRTMPYAVGSAGGSGKAAAHCTCPAACDVNCNNICVFDRTMQLLGTGLSLHADSAA